MKSTASFRTRMQQINKDVLDSPFPNLSAEMAQSTQRLRTKYGDISRGADDQQGITAAVMNLPKSAAKTSALCFSFFI